MESPYDKLAKIYLNFFGHMTKMTTTSIYSNTPLKSFSPEPEGLGTWYLALRDVGPTEIAKIIILG